MIERFAGPARRAVAAAVAFAIAAIGALALGPATAAEAVAPVRITGPALSSPVIDPARKASITIRKLTHDTPAAPVAGIDFTLTRIDGIDLTVAGGWARAFALSTAFDPAHVDDSIESVLGAAWHGADITKTTGSDGRAAFTGLDLGAYLVTERALGKVLSDPFIVLVPVTDTATRHDWLYHLDITPKDDGQKVAVPTAFVTKTVDDPDGHHVGDVITWRISGEILDAGDGSRADVLWWRMSDELDPRLQFVDATATLSDGAPFIEDTDYAVLFDTSTNTATIEVLGPAGTAGLLKVSDHHTAHVDITIHTKLLKAQTVPNSALLNTAVWDDPVGIVQYADPASAQVIVSPAADGGSLPFTGFDVVVPGALGAALTVIGFILVLVVRRRRDRDTDGAAA